MQRHKNMPPHLAFGMRIGYAFNKSDLLFRPHMQEGEPDEVIRADAGLRVFDPRVSLATLPKRPDIFWQATWPLPSDLEREV
jgi:hypothetical protein